MQRSQAALPRLDVELRCALCDHFDRGGRCFNDHLMYRSGEWMEWHIANWHAPEAIFQVQTGPNTYIVPEPAAPF